MVSDGTDAVTPETKRPLAHLIGADVRLEDALSPVSVAAQRLAVSLARSFESGKPALALFDAPDPLAWTGFGNAARAD
jgi:CRISPR-associated protein Cas1